MGALLFGDGSDIVEPETEHGRNIHRCSKCSLVKAPRLKAVAICKSSCLFNSQKEMTTMATIVDSLVSSGEAALERSWGRVLVRTFTLVFIPFPCFPAAPGEVGGGAGAWEETG